MLALGFLCLVCGVRRKVRCTYFTHVHLAMLLEPSILMVQKSRLKWVSDKKPKVGAKKNHVR